MPDYKFANVTCYCGNYFENARVTQKIQCSCGITLHMQQKKGGGRLWGTARKGQRVTEAIKLIQSGSSKLYCQFVG